MKRCLPYWFSGCGATQNLFSNERSCRAQCEHTSKGKNQFSVYLSCLVFERFTESIVVFVPSDRALMRYLNKGTTKFSKGEKKVLEHRVLMDETFARKCLLGSMKIMGTPDTLRPNWTYHFQIDYSENDSTLLGSLMIHILNEVVSVDDKDLKEALRTLTVSDQGDKSSYHSFAHNGRKERRSTFISKLAPIWKMSQQIDLSVLAYIIEQGNFVRMFLHGICIW